MESLKTIAKWHENPVATPAEKRLREKHDVLIDAEKGGDGVYGKGQRAVVGFAEDRQAAGQARGEISEDHEG